MLCTYCNSFNPTTALWGRCHYGPISQMEKRMHRKVKSLTQGCTANLMSGRGGIETHASPGHAFLTTALYGVPPKSFMQRVRGANSTLKMTPPSALSDCGFGQIKFLKHIIWGRRFRVEAGDQGGHVYPPHLPEESCVKPLEAGSTWHLDAHWFCTACRADLLITTCSWAPCWEETSKGPDAPTC